MGNAMASGRTASAPLLQRNVTPAVEASTAVTEPPAVTATRYWAPALAVIVYSVIAGLVFFDTVVSMVTIWLRSQTFAHGFLILPISLWLAWRLRARFSGMIPRPQPLALILVLVSGLVWWFAKVMDVQVIEQLAFVAVLVSGIWAVVGTDITRLAAFPLGFLFLAVPMGAGLIPPLMAFTADTTEFLVRASGIPVLREGMYLTLPTGTWSVIAECSGVRYLIASFTLGLLFAWLTYQTLARRAAFVLAAIVVPVLANSIRAYGVVMVGHLSEMRYGIGGDHLVYGWVFFGLVMMLMFWIGGFWQQRASLTVHSQNPAPLTAGRHTRPLLLGTLAAIVCASAWPAFALAMNRNPNPVAPAPLTIPGALGDWQPVASEQWRWQPSALNADREMDQIYSVQLSVPQSIQQPAQPSAQHPGQHPGQQQVGVFLRQYLEQHRGAELVTSDDPWRPDNKIWRVVDRQRTLVDLGTTIPVDEATVVASHSRVMVWSWYRVNGRNTANPYTAKLLEAGQQIVEGHRHGARVFIATPVGEDNGHARQVLQDFLLVYRSAIETSLDTGIFDVDTGILDVPPGIKGDSP